MWIWVLPQGCSEKLWFRCDTANEFAGAQQFFYANVENQFCKQIAKDRKVMYELGWKDAKSKKPKKDTFSGCLNTADESVAWTE